MNSVDTLMSSALHAPLIAGCVFLSLGLNYVLHFYRFRARSKHVNGTVKAIEKYVSEFRGTGNTRSSQTYYRPIVEFIYKDEVHKTFGPSVNEIRHKLGQRVTVMINESEDGENMQAALDDNLSVFTGTIFALVGLVALLIYIFSIGGSALVTLIAASTVWGLGYIISSIILSGKKGLVSSTDDGVPKSDSTLIETKSDYIKEMSSHGFWGGLIAIIFMLFSVGIMYSGYNSLSAELIENMQTDFSSFWKGMTAGKLPRAQEQALMVFGIGAFFFLASLRSVYYVRKKYGSLLRL